LLWAQLAVAQSNLGELLDAGAKKLSVEEFKDEVVQRVIVGPTATGGRMEVMYTNRGAIQGIGSYRDIAQMVLEPVSGEWKIDDDGRICTSMRMGGGPGGTVAGVVILPPRCQIWFKVADQYYLSDSDSDRRTKVLRRTIKQ